MQSTPSGKGVLWEVLAPIVRWPLWSPSRFFASIAAVLLVLIVVTRVTGSGTAPAPAAAGTTANTTTTATAGSSSPPAEPGAVAPSAPVQTVEPSSAVAQQAAQATRLWARPTVDKARWIRDLSPVVTPRLRALLPKVSPAQVRAHTVVSADLEQETPTRAVVRVTTDAGPVLVTLTRSTATDTTWLADTIAPQQG